MELTVITETFPILKNIFHPLMIVAFSLCGYLATDRLKLQLCIPILKGNKSWAVALVCLPVALAYWLRGEPGEIVFLNYMITNSLYSNILRYGKKYINAFFSKFLD